MATTYTCDYCGELINQSRDHAHLTAIGWDDLGDYHRSPCLEVIKEVINAACGSEGPRAAPKPAPTPMTSDEPDEPWRVRRVRWGNTPMLARDRAVLEALGDERMNISVLTNVVIKHIGYQIYTCDVHRVLKRLLAASEVERRVIPGYCGGPHPKWQYWRNAELRGPIADLEQAFDEPSEAA